MTLAFALMLTAATPAPAPEPWVAHVLSLRFTSSNGDGVSLSRAVQYLRTGTEGSDLPLNASVVADRKAGIVLLCFQPNLLMDGSCSYRAIARISDVGAPPGTPDEHVDGMRYDLPIRIGMTLVQLEKALSGAGTLQKGPGGSVDLAHWEGTDRPWCQSGMCDRGA